MRNFKKHVAFCMAFILAVVAFIPSTVSASSNVQVQIAQEIVTENVYRLTFNARADGGFNSFWVAFGFDNTVIQPVHNSTHADVNPGHGTTLGTMFRNMTMDPDTEEYVFANMAIPFTWAVDYSTTPAGMETNVVVRAVSRPGGAAPGFADGTMRPLFAFYFTITDYPGFSPNSFWIASDGNPAVDSLLNIPAGSGGLVVGHNDAPGGSFVYNDITVSWDILDVGPTLPTGITRVGAEARTVQVAATDNLAVTIVPTEAGPGLPSGWNVQWTSANTDVATVTAATNSLNATVTGVAQGTSVVTAQLRNGTANVGNPITFNITVPEPELPTGVAAARARLLALINEARALDIDLYTVASWDALLDAIEDAEDFLESIVLADINAAYDRLLAAMHALQLAPGVGVVPPGADNVDVPGVGNVPIVVDETPPPEILDRLPDDITPEMIDGHIVFQEPREFSNVEAMLTFLMDVFQALAPADFTVYYVRMLNQNPLVVEVVMACPAGAMHTFIYTIEGISVAEVIRDWDRDWIWHPSPGTRRRTPRFPARRITDWGHRIGIARPVTPPTVTPVPDFRVNLTGQELYAMLTNIAAPGVADGIFGLSVTGLPSGVAFFDLVEVLNGRFDVELLIEAMVQAGVFEITFTLYDEDGNVIFTSQVYLLELLAAQQQVVPPVQPPVPPVVPPVVTPPSALIRLAIGELAFTVNGIPQTSDAAPFIDPATDRTMVPLGVISEGLGATVTWVEATRTVNIVGATGQVLNIPIDQPLPAGMGMPMIVNDRTFVPVAYVSQMLGATVRWDAAARAVYIQQ